MLLHTISAPLHESDKVRFQGCVIYRPVARPCGIYVVNVDCIGAKYKHLDDFVVEQGIGALEGNCHNLSQQTLSCSWLINIAIVRMKKYLWNSKIVFIAKSETKAR